MKNLINTPNLKELWILGSTGHDADKCIDWYTKMPSFQDCDILLIDYNSFREDYFKSQMNRLESPFEEICKRIENGGILVCLLSKYYFVHDFVIAESKISHEQTKETRDMYCFLPVIPHLQKVTPVTGRNYGNIVFAKNYYKTVESFSYIIRNISNKKLDGHLGALFAPLYHIIPDSEVTTKGKDIVGCSYKYNDGIIHFLPPPTKISSKEAIDIIVQELKNEYLLDSEITKRPSWIDKYICDQEKAIIEKQIELEKKYNEKKQDLDGKRKTYEEIDKIVWLCGEIGNGKPLENAIKNFFEREFDLIIKKTEPGDYTDLKASSKDTTMKFAFEITGVKRMVNKDTKKVGQTMNYHLKKEENEKIVLIANTYCDKYIQQRSNKPDDNFSDYVVKPLKSMDVCLITTLQLFNLWKAMKKRKINKKKILKIIYETNGVFKE